MKEKIIFVDLDNTLFDTKRLGEDTATKIKEKLDISPEEYWKAGGEMFAVNYKLYNYLIHAKFLARNTGVSENVLNQFFCNEFANENSTEYLFNDSKKFLNECKNIGKTIILTYGEDFVQKPRLEKSLLVPLVDEAIVTQKTKVEVIKDYLEKYKLSPETQIFLVDDSIEHLEKVKAGLPNSVMIHIVRRNDQDSLKEHNRVNSLDEALDLIRNS